MRIALLGLGDMGAALGGALSGTYDLTVWNRTATKAEEFVRRHGTRSAVSVLDAVESADVVITCVLDYAATLELLEQNGVPGALRGTPLVQLSNGTPADVRRLEEWCEGRGVPYLDGAVMGGPRDVGKEHCGVAVCGPEELWKEHAGLFSVFGTRSFHAGADRAAGKAINAAVTAVMASSLLGFLHAAALAEAHDTPAEVVLGICSGMTEVYRAQWRDAVTTREHGTAPLRVWRHELRAVAEALEGAGLPDRVFRAMTELLDDAIRGGAGEQDLSTVIEALR